MGSRTSGPGCAQAVIWSSGTSNCMMTRRSISTTSSASSGRAPRWWRWRPTRSAQSQLPAAPASWRTQPYELLAGFNATIDYLDSIGGFEAIVPYERALGQRFLDGISEAVTVYGLPEMAGRVPTFLVNVDGVAAEDVAARRGDAAAS